MENLIRVITIQYDFAFIKIIRLLLCGLILSFISCAGGHHRPFEEETASVRDISAVQAGIEQIVSSSPYLSLEEIGQIAYDDFQAPMWWVSFRPHAPVSYRVLVNAGIHGNEPAGAAYALLFMQDLANHANQYGSVAVDIVPIVNPWGWVHDIRYNRDGIDINRDFATFNSREARIIADRLKDRQYDLMLDLHEDPSASGFYVYQYGMDDKTICQNVVEKIKRMGYPIEEEVRMVILKSDDGIIDAPMWGLWYMRITGQMSITNYYRLNHSQRVYTIETPTSLPIADRLIMQRTAVEMLIDGSKKP